ncbi:MAG: hypothetical protein WCX31_05665 [Salinivirgaceae bacterium]
MLKKGLHIICILGLFWTKGSAFTYPTNHSLLNNDIIKDSNALYLSFSNANYLWNNEFFSDVVNGYTLIGYFITPELQYHFNEHLVIQGGVHLLKYSGIDNYTRVVPTYSAIYTKNDFTLIMGNIRGTINHKLPEPILFSERYFANNLENGVQYILEKERFHFDTWLDWQNFIFPEDDSQEKLTAGISAIPSILKTEEWEVMLPASFIIGHEGGQIDTNETPMKILINAEIGIKAENKLSYKFLDKILLESHLIGFKDNSPTVTSIYSSGMGTLNQLTFGIKNSYFQIEYWKSSQFLSLMGHPIYQSYSEKGELYHQKNRELLNLHLFYSKDIYRGIYLGLMGDTYFDLINGNVDYSMGLTLIIKHDFFLFRR